MKAPDNNSPAACLAGLLLWSTILLIRLGAFTIRITSGFPGQTPARLTARLDCPMALGRPLGAMDGIVGSIEDRGNGAESLFPGGVSAAWG